MDDILGPLAFALLIGGQFLAAVVLSATRKSLYVDPAERVYRRVQSTDEYPRAVELQHCASPDIARAGLALTRRAETRRITSRGA